MRVLRGNHKMAAASIAAAADILPMVVRSVSQLRRYRLVFCFSACKGRVSNRNDRSFWSAQSYNLGVELLGKRLNNAGAKPGFGLGKDAVRFSDAVIGHGKFPICPGNFIGDGDLSVLCSCIESVL